jgi:hypothetical protein
MGYGVDIDNGWKYEETSRLGMVYVEKGYRIGSAMIIPIAMTNRMLLERYSPRHPPLHNNASRTRVFAFWSICT